MGPESATSVPIDCRMANGLFCAKCCRGTEMPLTQEDIERITSLGYRLDYFAVKRAGIYVLRNINGKCVFLDEASGACRIYRYRPEGCRLYPLICDPEKGVTLDKYCPRAHTLGKEVVRVFAPRVRRLVERIYGIQCP